MTAVIENTAGQGTNLGWSFEHLATLIDGVEDKSRVGVCFDTATPSPPVTICVPRGVRGGVCRLRPHRGVPVPQGDAYQRRQVYLR